MSPEELDKARAKEAWRVWNDEGGVTDEGHAVIAARLAREGWTPPEPVDPDVLAFREWRASPDYEVQSREHDFLAGARMAREQEQERAKVLVEPAEAIVNRAVRGTGANDVRWPHILKAAKRLEEGLTAYKAGKEAAQ